MKTHSMQTVVSKLRALSMLVACIGMVSTHAQNLTWNGGGSDANFSDANNWGGTAPAASGNIIFFDGSLNTSPTNSQSDDFYTFKGITFNSTASSFTLVGSRIDLNGGINNNTSGNPQMINNALALLANLTVSVAANGSLTNAGVISGSFALSKTNAGVLVLLGANSFTKPVTNYQGTIQVASIGMAGAASPLGAAPAGAGVNSPICMIGNSTPILQYLGPGETNNRSFYITPQNNHTITLDASGSGPLVFNSLTNLSASINNATKGNALLALTGSNTNNNTLAGDVYDNLANNNNGLAVIKSGPGTWFLQGTKHQNGRVEVQNGVLMFDPVSNVGVACSLGTATKLYAGAANITAISNAISLGTSSTAGTLQYAGSNTNTTDRVIGLNGSGTISSGVNGGSLVLNGAISNLTTSPYTLTLAGGGSNTVAGVISDGSGQTSLIVSSAGVWALTAANTFSGLTEPAAGVLQLGNAAALQSSVLDLEVGDTGTVDFGTLTSLTLGGLESGLNQSGGRNLNATNDDGTALPLVLTKNDGMSYAFSGTLNGGTTLTKTGSSIQSLGVVGLSGNTTINAGTLALQSGGSISSPQITVAGGAIFDVSQVIGGFTLNTGHILAGAGTVNGNFTASAGSTLSLSTNLAGGPTLTFSGNLTLTGGATNVLNLGTSTSPSVNDVVTVTGGLTLSGINTIVINPYLGSLANGVYPLIQYGSLSAGSLANLKVTPIAGYSLTLTNDTVDTPNVVSVIVQGVHIPASLTWKGNGSNNNWDAQTTADWLNGASLVDFFNNDSVTFSDISTNTTINLIGVLAPAAVEVNNSSKNYTLAGSGKVTATAALTKDGTGTLTVLTSDDNSGGTTINAGTIHVGNSGTGGWLGAGTITDNGALIVDRSDNNSLSALGGAGSLTQQGGGVLMLTNDTSGFSGNITVNPGTLAVNSESGLGSGSQLTFGGGTLETVESSADTFNRNVVINAAGGGFNHASDLTINSTITGSGSLTLSGTGTAIIPNAETYSGGTILNGGALAIDSVAALGTNALTINGGSLFRANGGEQLTLTMPVNLASNITFGNVSDGGLSFTNGAWILQGTAPASLQFTINTPVEIDSHIGQNTSGMGLTKLGNNTLTLTGSNNFTGSLAINLGLVTVPAFGIGGAPSPLGAAPASTGSNTANVNITTTAGTFEGLQYTGPGETTDRGIFLFTQDNQYSSLDASSSGALVFSSPTNVFAWIQNSTPGDASLILTGSNTNDNTFAGNIYSADVFSNRCGLAIVKQGEGTWKLQGVKNYSGRIEVQAGVLKFDSVANVGAASALGTAAKLFVSTSPIGYAISLGTNGSAGTLLYTGAATNSTDRVIGLLNDATISDGTNGGALVLNGAITNLNPNGKTLMLAGSGTSIIDGAITDVPGGLGLGKSEGGTWTLAGANTYTGNTTISGGKLLVNNASGSGTGSGAVNVNAGTFGGTGAVAGSVTYQPGTLALFTSGAPMTISGSLVLNGNTVHLNLPVSLGNGTYTLAAYNIAGSSGAFAATPVIDSGSLSAGASATVTTAGGNVSLVVSGGAAPQPHITSISLSGTGLVISGTNGLAGEQYNVLTSTNLTLPLSQWTVLPTNTFSGDGFSITNAVYPNAPKNFYLLRVP